MESRSATTCLSVDTARPATHHGAGAFLCALPACLHSGKLQANKVGRLQVYAISLFFSFCRSSSLRAPLWRWPKQYYKWVCEYLHKWLSVCLGTYPKSMQHFVARKTLKLLNCRESPLSSLLSAHLSLSLSVLHNIYRKKSWKIWMWNFIFGLRLDMTSKGNARRGTQSKRIGWLKVPAALALT